MDTYKQIFENNQQWVKNRKAADVHFFEKLAADQNPDYLYIGCSDSRVAAEEMMGVGPGKVFVHRNIANVVNTLDMSSTAVIQYAVEHLNVKHIVVCGHYDCGGVKAAMQAKDYGLLNPWLRTIRDVYRLHQQELDAIADADESYLQYRTPLVHGWVFDIHSGELIDLNIDFEDFIQKIQRIYDLTGEDWYKHY